MDHDSLRVGLEIIRKFVIKPTKICYRSVYDHPILVGFFLLLFYLYRSFPLLFQLLVSASPVLVCTAVLLGTLLSYGDNTTISSLIDEDDEKYTSDIAELKPDVLGTRTVVERSLGEDCEYTELSSEVVKRSFEKEPLLDFSSTERNYEYDGNFREIKFGKFSTDDAINLIGVGSSHVILERANSENFEDCKSAEESTDGKMSNMNGVLRDFADDNNLEHYETDKNSLIRDRLETPTGSYTTFDNFEDYISGEGSVDAQIGSPLELSLGSWNHLDSDRDVDDEESDSGSDGAESSSPDASLADIIPMLDELHPLLEDENPHTDGSDQHEEEEEVGDVKSDGDDENEEEEEEENQGDKEDEVKSMINWTEEDQKNMMELGTSDLERNQRLESLIARRRARRMVSERNLLDLEGMDLSFPIAPISTARYNPFDNNHDSYGDLGLPPIPGSAPSIMVKRQNPFDLPYDSSEEKPDLTGDSFQEEFMEINQRELGMGNQRLFKRNETFSVGSYSIFDFGRQTTRTSRFRPYVIPERTDSNVMSYSSFERQLSEVSESRMSYSSLQRQSSEISESKASSTPSDHESVQGTELSRGISHPSDYMENGSQRSEDVHSISDEENGEKDIDHDFPSIELIGVGGSPSASTEVDDDRVHHSKDAIYDSSPLAMKRNSSSSSSFCYDLQRKTSDIDLYHVQRDLFAEDETCISVPEKVQEPEDNIISSLVENDESFSKHDTTDNINISVSDLVIENNVRELYDTKSMPATDEPSNAIQSIDGSVADDLTMDEELLSELDAVGDFSVNNISLSQRSSYADDEVSSSIHFGDSTSLSDTADVENLKGDLNHVWGKESISDSYVRDINAGLLGLEDQSVQVEGIIVNEPNLSLSKEPIKEDTNVNYLNLGQNEKLIPDSSVRNADVEDQSDRDINAGTMEELEAAYIKSELPMETTEPVSLIETTLNEKEPTPEISGCNHVLREGKILDSSIVEPNIENSVNTDISEATTKPRIESDDDLQDFADKIEKSGFIDNKMMVNSIEPGYQMETVGSTGSELMQKDGDFKETPESPVLDSGTESQTLTVNLDTDEILERSVEGSFVQASKSEHQIGSDQILKVGTEFSEINTKGIPEPSLTEASIESEDLREIYSLMDNLVAFQQKPENGVSKSGDSEEIHVGDDSVAEGSNMGATEKSISLSMIKEEREPHDSRLEFSSSSSSNSSSSDSDEH